MSEHRVDVIRIGEVKTHPNADKLEIVSIGGWQAVVAKGIFSPGDLGVYIEPDYVVPTARPEFAFLAKEGRDTHRLRAVRLRGALSYGLLIPLPADLASTDVGTCAMNALGIVRYEPPVRVFQGGSDGHELPEDEWPRIRSHKFDIENLQRFPDIFEPGEPVIVSEKIHGANARFVFHDGKMFMGSRTRWLKPDADHIWARAMTESMLMWCQANQDVILFGEIYGPVQSLKYGKSEPSFVAFAALKPDGEWIPQPHLYAHLGRLPTAVDMVPALYAGGFDLDRIKKIVEGDSVLGGPGHIMEGVVIVPQKERWNPDIGRVALKLISNRYWESKHD